MRLKITFLFFLVTIRVLSFLLSVPPCAIPIMLQRFMVLLMAHCEIMQQKEIWHSETRLRRQMGEGKRREGRRDSTAETRTGGKNRGRSGGRGWKRRGERGKSRGINRNKDKGQWRESRDSSRDRGMRGQGAKVRLWTVRAAGTLRCPFAFGYIR